MSKGVLGLGCSYTWGEGLYFYSKLDNLPFTEYHTFDFQTTRKSFQLFNDRNNYLHHVSEYLDTWFWNKKENGGNAWGMYSYATEELTDPNHENFALNDFGLVIVQMTHHDRIDTTHSQTLTTKNQVILLNNMCVMFEQSGIPVYSIVWDGTISDTKEYKSLFKHRHINIEYDGNSYESFDYITLPDTGLTIHDDFHTQGVQKNDVHLNLKGHKVIADSIINRLKKDNFDLGKTKPKTTI